MFWNLNLHVYEIDVYIVRYRLAYVDYKHVLTIDSSADLAQQGATRYLQFTSRLFTWEKFLVICRVTVVCFVYS